MHMLKDVAYGGPNEGMYLGEELLISFCAESFRESILGQRAQISVYPEKTTCEECKEEYAMLILREL
jgi:hypothetical protein